MRTILRDESGATAVEYALLTALIAGAVVVVVAALGAGVLGTFSNPELLDALS